MASSGLRTKTYFRKYFQFQQARLFSDEWTMAQKWTTLNIPMINQYHKTKFSFTMTKEAPVVVVLSKLDTRYFRGFEGLYQFSLDLSIRKSARGIKRSVRAEFTLEAGRYEVSMRIEGMYFKSRPTIEELLQRPRNIHGFRQKLLRIARSYEIAHARGYDEDEKKRKARAAREKEKEKRKASKRPKTSEQKGKPKAGERDEEEEELDAGPIDGPRMSRSQAKSKKKAKGRPPPRAAQPEDEDELGNAGVAPPSSDSDVDDSELNSEVSDISDNEVEELKPPPKADTPAQAKQKEKENRALKRRISFELDPWIASVVVGLRVYSKLIDNALEVIRPDYEASDSSDVDEEDEGGGGGDLVAATSKVP
ncbi:hypothetical protein IFR04_012156 [Cadophora malorum]|uniref:Uncharacterized protein n=1 Tax=Cadophora malorum TaxID=108018 RepID=A0A8H7T917_9HELO|nr:hypothetical protein IFR04_012156 [Cadophora malorum]